MENYKIYQKLHFPSFDVVWNRVLEMQTGPWSSRPKRDKLNLKIIKIILFCNYNINGRTDPKLKMM